MMSQCLTTFRCASLPPNSVLSTNALLRRISTSLSPQSSVGIFCAVSRRVRQINYIMEGEILRRISVAENETAKKINEHTSSPPPAPHLHASMREGAWYLSARWKRAITPVVRMGTERS